MSFWDDVEKAKARLKTDATNRYFEHNQPAVKVVTASAGSRAQQSPVSSFSALLPHEIGSEISLGTVSSLSAAAVEVYSGPVTASATVPPDALQGIPLSDQEREDIAAGLTPAMARRASEARVDTLEWLLGLERMTQEQAERVKKYNLIY
jgi:hypothetical protein